MSEDNWEDQEWTIQDWNQGTNGANDTNGNNGTDGNNSTSELIDEMFNCCGELETTCTCSDCIMYFNPSTQRPIQGNGIDDQKFSDLLEFVKREDVKAKMKSEQYRSYIYQLIPYPMWKKLDDPNYYNSVVEQVKIFKIIPDDDPEICGIQNGKEMDTDFITTDIDVISYRFPNSTVKFELTIKDIDGKKLLRTHGRGI